MDKNKNGSTGVAPVTKTTPALTGNNENGAATGKVLQPLEISQKPEAMSIEAKINKVIEAKMLIDTRETILSHHKKLSGFKVSELETSGTITLNFEGANAYEIRSSKLLGMVTEFIKRNLQIRADELEREILA